MIWTSASLTFRRKIARLNHWAKIKRDSWRVLLRRYQDSLTLSFDSSGFWDLQNFSSSQPAWVLAKDARKRLLFVLKFILCVCQYFVIFASRMKAELSILLKSCQICLVHKTVFLYEQFLPRSLFKSLTGTGVARGRPRSWRTCP